MTAKRSSADSPIWTTFSRDYSLLAKIWQKYGFQVLDEVIEGEIRGHPLPVPMFLSLKSLKSIPG